MSISRIQVKNLFGNINYDINLKDKMPIGILTAPNGKGKTTIMNLLNFLLDPREDSLSEIFTVPFEEFRCVLSDGKTLLLRRIEAEDKKEPSEARAINMAERRELMISLEKKESYIKKEDQILLDYLSIEKPDLEVIILDEEQREIDKVSFTNLLELMLSRMIFPEDDKYIYDQTGQLYESIMEYQGMTFEWLGFEAVDYIRTDRIESLENRRRKRAKYSAGMGFVNYTGDSDPLLDASSRIAAEIEAANKKYGEKLAEANERMIKRFVDDDWEDNKLSLDKFMEKWSDYRNAIDLIQKVGMLKQSEDILKDTDVSKVYEEKGDFLNAYLYSSRGTIWYFLELAKKLRLFKRIFDERNLVTGKRIEFGEDGISLYSGDKKIRIYQLSSGEKHDFMMFYNLIFDSKPGNLVLIDEPEISLHIEWQESFIDNLLEICKMNGLQAIVATHSPSIVGSHYDLIVDKGETDA